MRQILSTVGLVLLIALTASCSKYKLVNVEEEQKAKEREEMKEELKKELKEELAKGNRAPVSTEGAKKTGAGGEQASAPSGWVRLYDDKGFTDRSFTVRFGRDIPNMTHVSSDDGKGGFNDKASAVKYQVPDGWTAVLYENDHYAKRSYPLSGSGAIADLGYFSDKCTSLRWEKK